MAYDTNILPTGAMAGSAEPVRSGKGQSIVRIADKQEAIAEELEAVLRGMICLIEGGNIGRGPEPAEETKDSMISHLVMNTESMMRCLDMARHIMMLLQR